MIQTVKDFSVVNEAEVDIFLEFSCFLYDLTNVGILLSGSIAFSISSWHIWKFSVHVLLKPSLKDFDHYLGSVWNERNCTVVWTFFGTVLLWDWNALIPWDESFRTVGAFTVILQAVHMDVWHVPHGRSHVSSMTGYRRGGFTCSSIRRQFFECLSMGDI